MGAGRRPAAGEPARQCCESVGVMSHPEEPIDLMPRSGEQQIPEMPMGQRSTRFPRSRRHRQLLPAGVFLVCAAFSLIIWSVGHERRVVSTVNSTPASGGHFLPEPTPEGFELYEVQ